MDDITLLHVGDIHFPDIDEKEKPLLERDKGFPQSIKTILPGASYTIILADFLEEVHKSPSAILLSGDLTTKGELQGYENCLCFFKERIPPDFFEENAQRLFIVPGNHDLVREKVCEESLFIKFNPMMEMIAKQEFPELPIPEAKFRTVNNNSSNILMISINSCVGCGEIRHFPEEIQEVIQELFEKIKDGKNKKLIETLYNELDTPVIDEQDIINTIKQIDQSEARLPIILSHHNLLPQRVIRLVTYSELLNGGHLRDKLMMLDRPIIFLHGHIHDDPIEIIKSPMYNNSKIICISAPIFFPNKEIDTKNIGFNKIKIVFGNETPIGCEIELHRLNGAKIDKRKERIRFWDPPDTIALLTPQEKTILSYVDDQIVYLSRIKERYEESSEKKITIEEVENYVDKLSWLGLVDYKKRDGPKGMRHVGKVIP